MAERTPDDQNGGEKNRLPERRGFGPLPADAAGSGGTAPAPVHAVEAMAMEEEIGLDDIWRVLRRQAWVVAAALVLVIGAVAAYTWFQTPVWEASTLIRIDEKDGDPFRDSPLFAMRRGDLETEMRVVTTRPLLERVVGGLDLNFRLARPEGVPREELFQDFELGREVPRVEYEISRLGPDRYRISAVAPKERSFSAEFTAGESVTIPGGSFTLRTEAELLARGLEPPEKISFETVSFEGAVASLQRSLNVNRPDPEARLFRVTWRHTDRQLVREVVEAVAQAFLLQRESIQKTEARSTVGFLREQTAQIRAQLDSAEANLRDFREAEQVVALESEAESQVRRLAELQADRSQLDAERAALRNLLQGIHSSAPGARPDYRRLVAFPTFLQNQTIQNLVASLTDAESRRTELRQRWRPSHPGIIALDEQIEELEDRLGQIGENYLQSLNDQIASLDEVLTRFGSELERVPGRELEYARLARQTGLLGDLHSFLEQRLKEAEIREAVEDPSVRVVEPAVVGEFPVSPRPARNLALATFLGLMLGVGLAFVREHMDKAIHADDDVDQILGIPVLSRIPSLPAAGNGASGRAPSRQEALVTSVAARSLPAESYRTLRTNVSYSHWGNGGGGREMVITSPGPKDGKSVTASNLAVTFAQQGRKTLLVDADMRKSVQHKIFDVERRPGLSDLLVGRAHLEEAVKVTKVPNLFLLPAGVSPPNPSELLGSPLMDYLLQKAREDYEAVIFDSPPALAVTDAAVLGGKMDGVLLVVRAERTHREAARDVVSQLRRVGAHVLGVVVNDAKGNGRYGYRYRYYYEYYGDDAQDPGARKGRGTRAKTLLGIGSSGTEEG